MTTTSPTPHQREHDQHPQRDTRQIEPCDWADALSAQSRTDTRLVYFCLGILAGALFCLGYLAGQNSQNDARPSAYPYPFAAPIPAAPGGPVAATPTPVVPTALSTVPAQAPTPATRTLEPILPLSSESAAALPAVSAPMRPGAGALAFIGSSEGQGRCDAPTGRDRDSRASVVRAGPVTVSGAGIDLARPAGPDLATERCDDPATTHPASSHDNNSTENSNSDPGDDSGKNSGKDKNHKHKNGQQRDRNGWDWPSDPPGWPGWRGDGPPPYNYAPGYVPGYGPGYGYGYGPGWGPGSAPGYGPYGYNYPPSGNRGDRGELGMCRVYRPGALRDLPDGGLVCTRDDQPTR